MLKELINLHQVLMSTVDRKSKRFLYKHIHWNEQAVCIYGARGVGKTTLLCQHLLDNYQSVENALYISADNVHVLSGGLLNIASEFFDLGGEALYIDEVHKYPDWSIEIKNIIDTFKKKKIIFSGSSAIELRHSKGDLSRRVVYHELPGLSFREYLNFAGVVNLEPFILEDVFLNHVVLAERFRGLTILKHFNDYLRHGFYPFFLEGTNTYLLKVNNVIEKIISEDIPAAKTIKPGTVIILKKLLWLVATATCLKPNIDKISKNLEVGRDIVYNGFEYLQQAGLINNVYPQAHGMKLMRKPGKIFMNNTNLLQAINGGLALDNKVGSIRETYFANQISVNNSIHTAEKADFIVNNRITIEVGGKNKDEKQIKSVDVAFLAVDGIAVGFGKRIPLYLFGCLY